jgi:hypothetical protein
MMMAVLGALVLAVASLRQSQCKNRRRPLTAEVWVRFTPGAAVLYRCWCNDRQRQLRPRIEAAILLFAN